MAFESKNIVGPPPFDLRSRMLEEWTQKLDIAQPRSGE